MPFTTLQEKDFFGRREELSDLYHRSLGAVQGVAQSIFLSGPRGIGKTEILKQLFNHLFWKQDQVVPFYYSVNNAILSVADFSRDYLTHYLCQRLAFENKEQSLLYLDGLSTSGLASLAEQRQAVWAKEILDRFLQSSGEPLDALRVALGAPHQSALSAGKAVVVMVDEFHRLKNLHIDGQTDPRMVSLFEAPLSFKSAPHVITGSEVEIQEMPVSGCLERVPLHPLGDEDASRLFLSMLQTAGVSIDTVPHAVIDRLGGNPFYIRSAAKAVGVKKKPGEDDFWAAYLHEVMAGNIHLYWSSVLKNFFPDLTLRRAILETTRRIYQAGEPLTEQRISTLFPPGARYAEPTMIALHESGLVRGEFGVFRAPEDRVVVDFIDCLYTREVLGKSAVDIEREFLEKLAGEKGKGVSFEITLPMIREAELVAAQCIEQMGRNLHLSEEVIGQMQIAVVEACINAMEHSKGADRKIYMRFEVGEDRLEASIESSGREFVMQETGEPFVGMKPGEDVGRGWGVKLMKRFMDSVRFEKTARGTKVVLVKHLLKSADVHREVAANGE
jgi:serine/threonine-protein kinase RsbW